MKFFFTDIRKALSVQCYTHIGVGQNYMQINRILVLLFLFLLLLMFFAVVVAVAVLNRGGCKIVPVLYFAFIWQIILHQYYLFLFYEKPNKPNQINL